MDERTLEIYLERINSVSVSYEENYVSDIEKLLEKLQEELVLDDLASTL